jgi:hypothetical protein
MKDEPLLFFPIAADLEIAGLVWLPEIGDEIAARNQPEHISILFDPQGMTPSELRHYYVWLPSVEQLVGQFEARQAILEHVGLELLDNSMCYRSIVEHHSKKIEAKSESFRSSLGIALRHLLLSDGSLELH